MSVASFYKPQYGRYNKWKSYAEEIDPRLKWYRLYPERPYGDPDGALLASVATIGFFSMLALPFGGAGSK